MGGRSYGSVSKLAFSSFSKSLWARTRWVTFTGKLARLQQNWQKQTWENNLSRSAQYSRPSLPVHHGASSDYLHRVSSDHRKDLSVPDHNWNNPMPWKRLPTRPCFKTSFKPVTWRIESAKDICHGSFIEPWQTIVAVSGERAARAFLGSVKRLSSCSNPIKRVLNKSLTAQSHSSAHASNRLIIYAQKNKTCWISEELPDVTFHISWLCLVSLTL